MKQIIYLNKVKIDSQLPAVNFTIGNAYAFAQAGYKTHLFVQSYNKSFDINLLYNWFELDSSYPLHINILPQKSVLGINSNQFFYWEVFRKIKELHKRRKINAVISRDPGALAYLKKIKKYLNIKVYYQPHNYYMDLKVRPDVNPKNAKKYQYFEKKYLHQMDGILCLQEAQAYWYRKHLDVNLVRVIKPGITSIVQADIQTRFKNKILGYIGSLQEQKGIDVFIEACSLLKKQDFRHKAVLIGGRNEKEISNIKKLIIQKGLEDIVETTGWLNYQEVKKKLQNISVGIIPLIDNFYNRFLTAPNKLFDYLSNQIPVIASDLPSIKAFINDDHTGYLVPAEDPVALADAIKRIFSSERLYTNLVQNTLKEAEKNTWKKQVEKLLSNPDNF